MKSFLMALSLLSLFACSENVQREEALDSDDIRETDSFEKSLPTSTSQD